MAIRDLREFIALLEKKGQLKPVDRAGGRDYKMPVLINTFGSYDRMAWALGVDAETGTWRDLDAKARCCVLHSERIRGGRDPRGRCGRPTHRTGAAPWAATWWRYRELRAPSTVCV